MTQVSDKPSIDEAIAHFGTKGMRWGVRNDTTGGETRKATKSEKKTHAVQWDQAKAQRLVDAAMKDPKVLISVKSQDLYPMIATGKEFLDHMAAGGLLNVRQSDIYAKQDTPGGQYRLQAPDRYQKLKRVAV